MFLDSRACAGFKKIGQRQMWGWGWFQGGCRTPWRHKPPPSQAVNPQTVVEHEGQEAESVWIFQTVLSLVVQKHSYMQDC